MKYLFVISFVIIIFLNSCNNKIEKSVEGDLYFKLIELESTYLWPDSILTRIENSSLEKNKDYIKDNKDYFTKYLIFLNNYNLLRKPFIRMRLDNGRIVKLFLDSFDFKKFTKYNWSSLNEESSKVRISVIAKELNYDTAIVYNAIKFKSINKIRGQTYGSK